MSYTEWFEQHSQKHKKIVQKLLSQHKTKDEIIDYFEFENMVKNEPNFCPLYAKNKKCHNIEYLNCYMCACPNFRFNDNGIEKKGNKTVFSYCAINSKDGRAGVYGEKIHQDCSKCSVPHTKEYIQKHYSEKFKVMMSECSL